MKPGIGNREWRITTAAIAALSTFGIGHANAAKSLRAVPPDQIDHYWIRTNTELDVDVPNFGKNLDKPTCSAVTYIIGSDGVTRDITVQRTVPAGDLALVAKSAVADLHYAPASGNDAREPVFTYIVMPFNLPADPAARAKITAACLLKDFPKGYQ